MRLPVVLSLLIGLGGCTISPTTVHVHEPNLVFKQRVNFQQSPSEITSPEVEAVEEVQFTHVTLPRRAKLPPLPNFSDDELTNPDVIEDKLVRHIEQLRNHISTYYRELDEFEIKHLSQQAP